MSNSPIGSTVAGSEKFAPATREDHDRFCSREGWVLTRGATGTPVKHHRTYELTLWDGRILRTRISRPVDKSDYAPSMWSHILRRQLEVTAPVFWNCVKNGVLPERGEPSQRHPKESVPLYLRNALHELGVSDEEILDLDATGAASLLAQKYSESQN